MSIKRSGPQTCDSCGREFTVREFKTKDGREPLAHDGPKYDWQCPHCGFDNNTPGEWAKHGQRIATKRSRDR